MPSFLKPIAIATSLAATCLIPAVAQTVVPFDTAHWTIKGKMEPEFYEGRDCIRLSEGGIYLRDTTFLNGVVEFDMALSQKRYFPGFGFRVQDPEHFENIYLRPHQRGNPDAIQYMPVYHGQEAWQLYYGEGFSTALTYPFDAWVHVKLVVRGSRAEVYIGDQAGPGLVIHKLKRVPHPGALSLLNGGPVGVRYANFRYTKTDNPVFRGEFKEEAAPRPGVIGRWQISSPFDEKVLNNGFVVPATLKQGLTWRTLSSEPSGMVNMSQVCKLGEGRNTAFAKITLLSDRPQIKKFRFGFSDKVRVYVNGRLVYAGEDGFMSRDYRFLGTTGYFDELYLDLKKGENEIWLAVTEDFGGWGVQGMLPEQEGLEMKP